MKIKVCLQDPVIIYRDREKLGTVDYMTFCLKVLSPRDFRRLERNPEVTEFDVRKIDLDQALAGWTVTWQAY